MTFLRKTRLLATSFFYRNHCLLNYVIHSTPDNTRRFLNTIISPTTQQCCSLQPIAFHLEHKRNFAKAKKSNREGNESCSVEPVPDIGPAVKTTALSQMEAAMVALSRELNKLRTGRASPGMLDHIIVEANNAKTPINRVAAVSVVDSKNLSVTPYDANTLKELERAISSSPLGLCPRQDGQRLVATIPPLTKEHAQSMCKLVSKSAEDVKQSIRRARQKALDTVKKAASAVPKEDVKRIEREIEEMTKKFVKSADDMCKVKENEIFGG